MQFAKISKALAGVAVFALVSTVAFADVWDKKTTLTVNETVEVPGATLQPGKYVVKLVDSQSNRHIVRFMNEEENEVLATVLAIPNERMERSGKTEFEFYETPAGQPPALKAWFYPGDTIGQEFAYPESRATRLSEITNQEVAHIPDNEAAGLADQAREQERTQVAQAPAPAPRTDNTAAERQARDREMMAQRERDQQAQAQRDRERQIAQAEQNQQQRTADPSLTAQQTRQTQTTQQSQSTQTELPETAGLGALLALIGLGSLGASRAVRKMRK